MKRVWVKQRNGFTLVELLIAIVVIAVLAAISVVAYQGIQGRATYARQSAEMDKIGNAIRLWSAENGTNMYYSGAGHNGNGLGGFKSVNTGSYTSLSIEQLLLDSGYLKGPVDSNVLGNPSGILLSPCSNSPQNEANTRWVVYAYVTPAPKKSVAEQIADTDCNNGFLNLYTNSTYQRNMLKVY